MKSVTTHPTPQRVIDAIQVVAVWLREIDAPEALISPQGGASFHAERQADRLLAGWEQARAWGAAWKQAAKWWRGEAAAKDGIVEAAYQATEHGCEEPNYILCRAIQNYEDR